MLKKMITAKTKLLLLSSLLLGGCSESYLVLLKNPDGTVGEVVVKGTEGETVVSAENYAAKLNGSSKEAFLVSKEQLEKDFGQTLKARPPLPVNFLLYFQAGGTELTAESKALFPEITKTIAERQGVDISIIGHTDSVGSPQMNEQLALQRAVEISHLFDAAKLKIQEVTVTSHGEKNQLIKTPDESDEPRNRRVEITVR